jgi:hypothetical protein
MTSPTELSNDGVHSVHTATSNLVRTWNRVPNGKSSDYSIANDSAQQQISSLALV